jgi:signal transduction histidine kinase
MKQYNIQWIKSWVKSVLPFYLFAFLPLSLGAQGLPLIRNYTAAEYGGHNRNYDIEMGEDGTVYVANFEGLLYYDRARWRMIHTSNINRVTVVYRDSKNTIWVGGYNYFARLQKQANGTLFLQEICKKDFFKGEVLEIFEDEGSLQFVVSDNNIYEIKNDAGKSVPTVSLKKRTNANFRIGVESQVVSLEALKQGDDDALLNDITQTEELDGGLQVKIKKNHGLIVADAQGRELYTITEDNGLCSNQVAYVAYDGHGVLWGATAHGIFSLELPSVYSYFLPKDGLTGEVHAITAFNGQIYVGCTNGLYVVSSRHCKCLPDINNICWTLCESRYGLLAATSSGIYKITQGGTVTRLTSNATTAIFVDGDKVYAGEPDAVWLYQSDFKQRTKVNDLPLVTDIRQDAHGGFWFQNVHAQTIGKDPGKVKAPLDELPKQLLMPISDIEVKAQYRFNNQIWIGGDEILTVIDNDKKDLAKLTDCRTVRFTSIVMGSDSVLWGGYGDMPKKLQKLGSDEGNLHFFYALSYAPLSGKTLYRYKLNNNKWSAWSDRQDVDFLNLPYGSFTLSVQAQLANGELSEVKTVEFSIAYPLLMRWYMVVLYFILFVYIVFQLFRYRLKRLQKDKIKLEQIVEERTADLRNAQSELIRQEKMASVGKLTEGLIDRILNPMNYIINFSKMSNDLLKDLKENINNNKDSMNEDDYEDTLDVLDMLTENLQNVDQYGQNTTRTLKAMEEMLKDRTGGYVAMDLLPVLQQNEKMVNNYFAKEKEQYHIQTIFNLPGDAMPLHGNPDMLSKTIMSLLGNAVYAVVKKYQRSPYTPEVSLTATIADSQYILKIHDNGTGIGESTIGKIFDPFFTTKTTAEAAGVGLYLSREIIQNHGGDISVTSVKGQYTEFTITLPVGKGQVNNE